MPMQVVLNAGRRFAALGATALACALLCLLFLFLRGPAPAYADDGVIQLRTAQAKSLAVGDKFVKGGNTYKVTEIDHDSGDLNEVKLVRYGSSSKRPVVDKVKYKGVTYEVDIIGQNAFNNAKGRKITTVRIGACVDVIGKKAFYGCKKLEIVNMAKADVVDIDKTCRGYRLDEAAIGQNAFAKAGKAGVKVKCGKSACGYRAVFKCALAKKGLRKDAVVVK